MGDSIGIMREIPRIDWEKVDWVVISGRNIAIIYRYRSVINKFFLYFSFKLKNYPILHFCISRGLEKGTSIRKEALQMYYSIRQGGFLPDVYKRYSGKIMARIELFLKKSAKYIGEIGVQRGEYNILL